MDSMVERVARAIYENRNGHGCKPWSILPFSHRDPYRLDARAAIEAMREDDLRLELAKRKFNAFCRTDANGCIIWTGAIDKRDGYGRFYDGSGKTLTAYKFAWLYFNGAVPAGMVLDHVCRNRACVNHEHLRAVTNAENILCGVGVTASNARKTACDRGHPFSEENIYVRPDGARGCRECLRDGHRRHRAKKRTAMITAALEGEKP